MKTMQVPDTVAQRVQELGGLDNISKKAINQKRIKDLSQFFHAASDPIRVKILCLLDISALCVCLIKEILDISDSKLSYHLSTLKSAGLISDQRQKNFYIYRITPLGKRLLNFRPHSNNLD